MITCSWRTAFAPDEEREVGEMLAAAAEADAEAGFPAVSLAQPYPEGSRHLVVRLLPDERPGHEGSSPVAAYLRVEPDPDGGLAMVRYVVRPEFRSRGISTLLVERIGLNLETPGLRVWARGDHPAAQRMARRFECAGVRTARREWQLLAPLRDCDASVSVRPVADAAEQAAAAALWRRCAGREEPPDNFGVLVNGPDVAGAAWYNPKADERTEYGIAGRIISVLTAPGRDELRAGLIAAAMAALRERGLLVAAIAVDAEDRALARTCRLLGFRHDRTDIEYTVGPVNGSASAEVT